MICVNSVSVYPKSISLKVGTWSYAAYTEVCPSNADCKEVQWHSDNPSVASVNASGGYIYANGVGTAHIFATATDGSGCSDYLTVTVSNTVSVTSVTLNHSSLSLEEGHITSLSATVCPDNATNKNVNWTSSNNSVATVSGGVVTAVAKGSAKITATAADGSGKSASCTVTVTGDTLVESICISPDTRTMIMDKSAYFYATVCPENATNRCVTWSSDDPCVATVNAVSGLVYAENAGTTVIRATAQDGSGIRGSCYLTVLGPVPVQSISLNDTCLELHKGETYQLTATVYPSKATNKSIKWYSCNESIATIDENTGVVTAVGTPGQKTSVYAEAQDGTNVCGCCELTVDDPIAVESVTLSHTKIEAKATDADFMLVATVSPANAYDKTITWRSSNVSVATVNSNGLVSLHKDGTAVITATSTNNRKASCTIKVDSREKATVLKDNHSFTITFENGKVWRNIGLDLSKREENYDGRYSRPMFDESNYHLLILEEQRYLDNIQKQTFTEKEIAFLYSFDPLGIEYYMRNKAVFAMSTGDGLLFKDRVYKKIFGSWPRLIKVFPNKNISYYDYYESITPFTRADYYSDAEILFGDHVIYDLVSVISFLIDVVPSVSLSLFSIFYPPVGVVLGTVDLVKFLFFSASTSNFLSSGTSQIMEAYTSEIYTVSSGEIAGQKAGKAMGWVNFMFSTIFTILDASEVFTPPIHDLITYQHVNSLDYSTKYIVQAAESSVEFSIDDILAKATTT